VEFTTSFTLSAIAIAPGELPSTPKNATFELPTATPVISLPAGTYEAATVQITDATPGAAIYYTTNNSAPTIHSTVYSGPIEVKASETIKAMALAPGSSASAVASATYTISAHASTANQWTWMGGSSTLGANNAPQPGFYGTLKTAAKDNIPGGRQEAMAWTDKNGNGWLFGGFGADSKGQEGYLNDLWELNTATGEWAWMGGNNAFSGNNWFYGVYGSKNQFAAANQPGSRYEAATWVDKSGNLWLFGGYGYDGSSGGNSVNLNDLWEFNISKGQWAWIAGPQIAACPVGDGGSCQQPGKYGTERVAAAGNIPGGRSEAVSWVDSSGNLWLFGGSGIDSKGVTGNLNELWKFNPTTKEWAWMSGSETIGAKGGVLGVYGDLGVAHSGNYPGGRIWPDGWTDASGNLWLFGGDGFDIYGDQGELNDLWEYKTATNVWTWMGGSDTTGIGDLLPGTYGTLGASGTKNTPGGRSAGLAWKDNKGNGWIFGGYGADGAAVASPWGWLNDLWQFNSTTHEWTWMGGSSQAAVLDSYGDTGMPGAYGAVGAGAAGNAPGSREYTVGWTDANGNFWVFGGYGVDAAGNLGYLNDVWKLNAVAPAAGTPER
jgi:N-acetylneuraminic acid mutarotase